MLITTVGCSTGATGAATKVATVATVATTTTTGGWLAATTNGCLTTSPTGVADCIANQIDIAAAAGGTDPVRVHVVLGLLPPLVLVLGLLHLLVLVLVLVLQWWSGHGAGASAGAGASTLLVILLVLVLALVLVRMPPLALNLLLLLSRTRNFWPSLAIRLYLARWFWWTRYKCRANF